MDIPTPPQPQSPGPAAPPRPAVQPQIAPVPPAQATQPQTQQPPVQPAAVQDPGAAPMPVNISASQMGYDKIDRKFIDFKDFKFDIHSKKTRLYALIAGGAIVILLIILMATNVIAVTRFRSVAYANNRGSHFRLDFYSRHSTAKTKSNNKQLVSKVSVDDKFPITLSISTGELSGYNRVKGCANFTKAFDVQNKYLNQKISVCDMTAGQVVSGANASNGVYLAGFMVEGDAYLVTIGQDYSSIDLSSAVAAKESVAKFGLTPYKQDIERIISSIKLD